MKIQYELPLVMTVVIAAFLLILYLSTLLWDWL